MFSRHLAAALVAAVCVAGPVLLAGRPAGQDARALEQRSKAALAQVDGELAVPGLQQPVEVIRDTWGVPHIYAKSTADLFFAQGYVAAQDRLWQLDLWRRNADGTLAEVVGPTAVKRDTFARLLRFRGDMAREWTSYSPDAKAIIEAFVAGVNAQIAYVRQHPDKLPIEFQLLDSKPEPWTPEVVLGRMAGYVMTRNARSEVQRARLARQAGVGRVAEFMTPDPPTPIVVPDGLDLEDIVEGILDIAGDASETVRFPAERLGGPAPPRLAFGFEPAFDERVWADHAWMNGSNNWVMDGSMTTSGKPILANDPHRVIALPSLRYSAHLNAPGWNVIGAGEPALPGIAAGHNDHVAFGFTIVGMDQQDLYVEKLDPLHADHYFYQGSSLPMTIVREQIAVRGEGSRAVELRFTKHGPVLHIDRTRQRAYVLRWVGAEPGSAGYLRSLALNRATNWPEFRAAVAGWKVPSENLIYADTSGNIGWIAGGAAPIRPNWNGLLPVPGDSGKYEWNGFLGIDDLPQAYNPAQGYIATANHNILPAGYTKMLGYEWSAPHRFRRIDEVLRGAKAAGRKLTVADSERLQHDATSMVARAVCDALRAAADASPGRVSAMPADAPARQALQMLTAWDRVVGKDSGAAALFELWMPRLSAAATRALVPEADRGFAGASMSTEKLLTAIAGAASDGRVQGLLLGPALDEAWQEAVRQMGPDPKAWAWGRIHRIYWEHPLASTPERRTVFNLPDAPRSGDGNTPLASGNGNRQTAGASFREVIDLSDWDRSTTINTPGQSGQPGSRFYGNLAPMWAAEQYHPMVFTRQAVEKNAAARLVLTPAAK